MRNETARVRLALSGWRFEFRPWDPTDIRMFCAPASWHREDYLLHHTRFT